ncbi:MAG TPA: hypothetical protein VGK46_03975 [Saprospiraceae bacterium]|jgi:hypothetical protein
MNAKTIITYIAMLAGVILSGYFGPWWAPAAFVVLLAGLMQMTSKKAILAGGFSVGIVYMVMAIWMNSMDKADIIGKTGMLMGGLSSVAMIIVTTLIGLITGVFAGWVGSGIGGMLGKA